MRRRREYSSRERAPSGREYHRSPLPVYVDTLTSEPMIIMAVPVIDVFRDFQGVLIVEVNLKFMWDLVGSMKIEKTGLAYVVDRQGKLIAFNDISRVLRGENTGNLMVVHEFIGNPVSAEETRSEVFKGINGKMVLGTYVSLGVPDWAVMIELPVAEAYDALNKTIFFSAIFTILMAALAGWIGISVARRLSVPIVSLMETATRIAGGEMELNAEPGGPLEISRLAKAFNSMTGQLREVIGRLEQRGRYLQETVKKYVDYMIEVEKGNLDSRLELGDETQSDDQNTSLIILGQQFVDTTANLRQMIEQIQNTTAKLIYRIMGLDLIINIRSKYSDCFNGSRGALNMKVPAYGWQYVKRSQNSITAL